MYHVTNVSDKEETPKSWMNIEARSIANDKIYDGDLFGLPLASFTTTSYINQDALPTTSPYPRNAQRKEKHHRVKTRFVINDYYIYLMGEHKTGSRTQIQLLCIRKQDRDPFEDKVYSLLQNSEKASLHKYFPNQRSNIYDSNNKMFVNVHFTYAIDITGEKGQWDTVERGDQGTGEIDFELNDIELSDLRSMWCIFQEFKIIQDEISGLAEKTPKILDYIKPMYNKLKKLYELTGVTQQLEQARISNNAIMSST